MQRVAAPHMDGHRLFQSRDPDEARAFLATKDYEIDLALRDADVIDLRVNGVYLPGTYIGFYQYGAPLIARTHTNRHDYWINFPLADPIEATIGGDTFICGPEKAFVASPTLRYVVRTSGSGARVHVQIKEEKLICQLSALLGERPLQPIVFAPSIDLTKGYGRSLALYVRLAVSRLENGTAFAGSPLMIGQFEEAITTKLLISHPSNYSDVLARLDRPIAPASVKRAVEYINAGLGSPLSIAQIAAVSGVAGRTLFKHFHDTYGATPMRYLRDARLDKVREALMCPGESDRIMEIAIRWGFAHLGRFAVEYRERFGETPSQTLKRSLRQSLK
jgi:AraC-like DNA-binding protein